ncbi:MAG: N-acetylneuraminate synthase family protein [Balneolales bacterium]
MTQDIVIGNRQVGKNAPVYIIAEAGVNHNGKLDIALELVRKAKEIGADCIKFQTFKADAVITKDAPKAEYQLKVTDQAESQYEMLKSLELGFDDYQTILEECDRVGIDFLSTPYNKVDVDFLFKLGVKAFKIASGQLVELDFLNYVASKNLPIILSTGMGKLSEASKAIEIIRETGNEEIVLLQCVTNYPADIKDVNLKAMTAMGNALDVLYGYSDHVPMNYAAYASVALGASVVEKHFTLDTKMKGPDHSSSLDYNDFQELIRGIRAVESSLGSSFKKPSDVELKNSKGMRRSIVFKDDLPEGTVLDKNHFTFKRPSIGLKPELLNYFIGKVTATNVAKDTFLGFHHIDWQNENN